MQNKERFVTIFNGVTGTEGFKINVNDALARIKTGRSRAKVEEIRASLDKAKADALKKTLPAVIFSGTATMRGDANVKDYSGLIVLDFDKLDDVGVKMAELQAFPHTFATWVSPSGNGVKALICVADGSKHQQHYDALREHFKDLDTSGRNVERLCFESYDPHLWHNPDATPFKKVVEQKQVVERVQHSVGDAQNFKYLLKWIANKGGIFQSGERNHFVFRLAGACCRFGLSVEAAAGFITAEFPASNDFTYSELMTAVKSGYKANRDRAGSVVFEKEQLIDRTSRREVQVKDLPTFDLDAPAQDVVYGAMVKTQADEIYNKGYPSLKGINVQPIDQLWKPKRMEVTCLTGIGNMGKTAYYKWYQLMRCLLYGEKFATFSPEENPPEEYYFDFVEMLLGCDCTPANQARPPKHVFDAAYDWVSKHFFYLYPEEAAPTPEYVNARFLEMIVKEKVDWCTIDPFNMLTHTHRGNTADYLEEMLTVFKRFAEKNNVFYYIVAHPVKMMKNGGTDYPCPDVFDLAGGAMWNNKMHNILVYHRPFASSDPINTLCELHSKKIRKGKSVGKKGGTEFNYSYTTRRYLFEGADPMAQLIKDRGILFGEGQPAPVVTDIAPANNYSIKDLPADFWD